MVLALDKAFASIRMTFVSERAAPFDTSGKTPAERQHRPTFAAA